MTGLIRCGIQWEVLSQVFWPYGKEFHDLDEEPVIDIRWIPWVDELHDFTQPGARLFQAVLESA